MTTVRNLLEENKHTGYISVTSTCTVLAALKVMAEKKIGAVMVTEGGKIVGIYTEHDYLRKGELEGRVAKGTLIKDVMTPRIVTVTNDTSVEQCIGLMKQHGIRHLPVVENDKVTGLISMRDVLVAAFDSRKSQSISNTIIGSVIGDVIGSVFEWNNIKSTEFGLFNSKCDFTDDTVLTIAVADCLLNKKDFSRTIWEYGRKYRGRGYGGSFREWLQSEDRKSYGSFGNGSAMRVSPVGFAFDDIETVMDVARQTAEVTHNHPEGIKGAQATATAIFLARQGKSKQEIKDFITTKFKYNLGFTLDEIRPTYKFDVTCQGSVPQAIIAFLESSDFESAIRLAISIGGDSDTIACITGGIASAFYKQIPKEILDFVTVRLPGEYVEILSKFDEQYDGK